MVKPLVVILMGSKSDLEHCKKIADACKGYGMDTVLRIGSAHKTPDHILSILREYESNPRQKVFITVAGRSNALSGFTDGAVSVPVIACPPVSDAFAGADIVSSLRMPSGIAPALVIEPANAALLAAKILGLVDSEIHSAVLKSQKQAAEKIMQDDQALQ
ncbi:MAG TPA: AIR carboxylase family protein [Anaerolineales bacterium]|nr:AIR carboxylase family protein [Anaerolineales bacterium]